MPRVPIQTKILGKMSVLCGVLTGPGPKNVTWNFGIDFTRRRHRTSLTAEAK